MPTRAIASELGRNHPSASRAPGRVERPRLLDLLRGGPRATNEPIVALCAPPGAGKSVLLGQWLDVDEREHLEVPLTRDLDEPAALLAALVDELERIGPPAPDLRAAGRAEPGSLASVLRALGGLVASRAADYVLVLDDLHVIRDPECHRLLLAVCEAMPRGSQVVLLSREPSPPWLARARADGRLNELDGHDLALDPDEVERLLRASGVVALGEEVGDLVDRAEGWAVALNLVARAQSREKGARPDRLATRRAQRFVTDYVTTQVLQPLDPELQSFALRTSVLDELTPDLCDAVLDRNDSAAVLARLGERLQLLVPLDLSGQRVRYHHLFADALRAEAVRRCPADLAAVHTRAARWYADRGDLDAAIRHAKAGGASAQVGALVWSGLDSCLGTGDTERLALWLCDLSEPRVEQDRWLTLAAAWLALQTGDTDRMARLVLRAEGHAGRGWRRRAAGDEYAAAVAVLVALVGRGGLAEMRYLGGAAGRGLPADSGFRTAALFIQGVALTLERDLRAGRQCLAEAERLAGALGIPLIRADALSWQGVLALTEGDLRAAGRLIAQANGIIREHRLEELATAVHCLTAQALAEALANDHSARATLAAARQHAPRLEDAIPWFAVCARLIQARAAVALGERALARQLITEAATRMTPDLEHSLAQDLLVGVERALTTVRVGGVTQPELTAAELRILRHLPSHLQMTQIGEQLFLSKNTVKTHTKAIYRKLGVESRGDAVHRARQLGLLDLTGGPWDGVRSP